LIIDTESDGQYGQYIKQDDPEESRFDCPWDSLVRLSGLSSGNGDKLDSTKGKEREHERLCESGKAADERLGVVEIGETLDSS
jgi:hypothetical protein